MTNNSTWCQNRGCICISSVRRTYGRIHIPATIILWTELFPKKRREKISKERFFNLSSSTVVFPHFYKNYSNSTGITRFLRIQCIPIRTTVFLHAIQQVSSHPCAKKTILHTELILLQELQGSSRTDHYKASSSNCPRVSKHSTWQNKAPGYPTALAGFQLILPGRNSILSGSQHPRNPYSSSQAHSYKNSTRRNRILSKRVKYCMSMQY